MRFNMTQNNWNRNIFINKFAQSSKKREREKEKEGESNFRFFSHLNHSRKRSVRL